MNEKVSEDKKTHAIKMQSRRMAELSGVVDVLSFDEDCVVADTVDGAIVLRGRDLHVSSLDLDKGALVVDGEFSGFTYEESPAVKTSVFSRIFK